MKTLSTGIDAIDQRLQGGLTAGNLVAVVSPPDAPSSRLLYQLMRQRPTTYLSTLRPRSAVADELMQVDGGSMDVTIEEIGDVKQKNNMLHAFTDSSVYSANTTDRERILDEVNDIVYSIDGSRNVVVDPMNVLESSESRSAYQRLLRSVGDRLREVDGLGLFHCLDFGEPPKLRETTMTIADTVWNIDLVTDNDDNLAMEVTIPKNRRGPIIFEKMTVRVDKAKVYTDRSRAI